MSDLLYRKKPVVIEAMQFQPVGSSGEDAARVESWCGGEMVVDDQGYSLVIKTLEGHMRASPGDWIIKGVKGEFYPCKPDIFEQTYESAALPAAQPDPREAALRDIARQKKTDEMDTEYDVEYADFEGGYNAIIDVARVALRAVQPDARGVALREAAALAETLSEKWREEDGMAKDTCRRVADAILALLDKPAVQPDPDQMREDRDERTRLAREDDQ